MKRFYSRKDISLEKLGLNRSNYYFEKSLKVDRDLGNTEDMAVTFFYMAELR